MRERNNYRHGDHNVICEYSGFKIKRSEARYTWDGHLVKEEFWEPRHPQDFLRGKADNQAVRDARPEGDNDFISTNEVTADSL